jgi:hypothetical protein
MAGVVGVEATAAQAYSPAVGRMLRNERIAVSVIESNSSCKGWDRGAEWRDLVKLWYRESSWNQWARNRSSGAIGIPQLLPSVHHVPQGYWDWRHPLRSARVQIRWGLNYIRKRYGNPARAWAHERAHGWY